jgi:hypothetical protein
LLRDLIGICQWADVCACFTTAGYVWQQQRSSIRACDRVSCRRRSRDASDECGDEHGEQHQRVREHEHDAEYAERGAGDDNCRADGDAHNASDVMCA